MAAFVYISFAQAATCSYKHARMHKQMSDKHVYHTHRDTHTCILRQRARSRALPAARDLWENRTPPVLFISPSRANTELPSNWSRLRLLSLIQTLIAACLLFLSVWWFFFFLPPSFFFPLPKVLFLYIWSQRARFRSIYFKSRQGFLWEIKLRWVPGSLRLRSKPDFLLDNVAAVAREECGHQVIDSVYMWMGRRGHHIFVSVFTLSQSFTSLLSLCYCFAFGQLCIWSADRLMEDRLDRGQVNPDAGASFLNTGQSESFQHAGR